MLEGWQRRRFWQGTWERDGIRCVVEYANGMLIPTIYIPGRGRRYPASVPASRFVGREAPDERVWVMGLISSALGSAPANSAGTVAADAAFEKKWPVLHAFMTAIEEDGRERTPSSLVIFTEDGQWKACLTEKDANLRLWRSAEGLEKVLGALEKALAGGNADWRKGFDLRAQQKGKKIRGK